jgi:hypothetical protein
VRLSTRSIDTGKSKLDCAIRVAVTTMVDSSGASSAHAGKHAAPKPKKTLASDAAIRPRMILESLWQFVIRGYNIRHDMSPSLATTPDCSPRDIH